MAHVYGVEVAEHDADRVRKIADLLYAASPFSYAEKGRKDTAGVAHQKCARIAVKAVDEAKAL